jgi:hypothetical protein
MKRSVNFITSRVGSSRKKIWCRGVRVEAGNRFEAVVLISNEGSLMRLELG